MVSSLILVLDSLGKGSFFWRILTSLDVWLWVHHAFAAPIWYSQGVLSLRLDNIESNLNLDDSRELNLSCGTSLVVPSYERNLGVAKKRIIRLHIFGKVSYCTLASLSQTSDKEFPLSSKGHNLLSETTSHMICPSSASRSSMSGTLWRFN